jgi:mannose-1-phosphate guanylyltransferase
MDRDAIVAILPCDHYYSSENMFTNALESAFAVAEARPQSVVLLGAQPTAPEVEYGWIELGKAVDGPHSNVFHVRGFQEKPPFPIAENLLRIGSLWNTFVMVGHVNAFLELALASVPDLFEILGSAHISSDSDSEIRVADWLYDQIAPVDFSRQILSPGAKRLVTVGLGEVEWNDLGDPERVISTLLNRDSELPAWVMRWRRKNEYEPAGVQLSASAAIA